jgi:gliding motility-associated-like protein
MKWVQTIIFFAFICCNTLFVSAQNITVDDTKTAQQLVEKLVNSSCANFTNFSVSGDNYTAGYNSYGEFNKNGSSFPFEDGIVLSTWSSINSVGPFVRNQGKGSTSWIGDTDLNQALNITTTINATFLEFDFIPLTSLLSFNYIFASNEYQDDFPCRISDGFAFLIKVKGSATNYQNLAVIPGSTTPVSSTSIHQAISFIDRFGNLKSCSAINETYFASSNISPTNTSPINYAGQTIVMNAKTNVVVGTTYHIKLVISDADSKDFDSAVFLQAGSFSPKIDLGSDRLITNNPICYGDSYIIDTQLLPTYTYKWYKDGSLTPIPGETKPSLTVTGTGKYNVIVELGNPNCTATGEIRLEFTPEIVLSDTTLAQCDDNNDGITIFDLTRVDNIIKNNNSTLSPVVYYESLSDAKGKINPIANPATYQNKPSIPYLFAQVTNTFGCANYAQVNLVIANNIITSQNPISTCDGDAVQDGLYQFDLNLQVTPQILSGLPSGMIVEYYLNPSDAISQKNSLPNIFKNTIQNQEIIQARIVNGPDCYGIVPIILIVNAFNPPNFQDDTSVLCIGSTSNLSVASGYSSYLWNTGATINMIPISATGNYSVTVTNANSCKAVKKFFVTSSEIATITDATVNDFAGNENSVLIQYTGVGNYEFSLDGSYFQDNPLFTGIAPGNYLGYARDKNGCGLSDPFNIYVLDYPRFFTPNGDGLNDVWKIKNLDLFPKATITIYDRYGKLIKELNAMNPSWNGTYIGNELPATDYWFNLNLGDGKIIKGHFSLKR